MLVAIIFGSLENITVWQIFNTIPVRRMVGISFTSIPIENEYCWIGDMAAILDIV